MSRPPLHLIAGVPASASWRQINLDEYARADFPAHKIENPLILPEVCTSWVQKLASSKSVDYTYGGYMEDRSHLWRGHYMKRGHCVHYGVDLNVFPLGYELRCPRRFRVYEMFHNADQNGGWGGRLTVETDRGIVVFAHIDFSMFMKPGRAYEAGHVIGSIAPSYSNGGWYPHLHLQGLRSLDQLAGLDGYGKRYRGMERDYPNPLEILL